MITIGLCNTNHLGRVEREGGIGREEDREREREGERERRGRRDGEEGEGEKEGERERENSQKQHHKNLLQVPSGGANWRCDEKMQTEVAWIT